VWTGASLGNWKWLRTLALCLNEEFKYRYDRKKDHSSAVVIRQLPLPPVEDQGLTEFAQTMPE
jgi:hypothetical protein